MIIMCMGGIMKYKVLIVVLILILLIIGIKVFLNSRKEIVVSNINHLSFFYTRGYAMNADIRYEMDCNDGMCVVTYKPYGVEKAKKKNIDNKTMKKIEDILNKYEVGKWDGFNKNDKNVLDGDSFSMYINMIDGTSISASGYMKWPTNYRDVRDELDSLFEEIFK